MRLPCGYTDGHAFEMPFGKVDSSQRHPSFFSCLSVPNKKHTKKKESYICFHEAKGHGNSGGARCCIKSDWLKVPARLISSHNMVAHWCLPIINCQLRPIQGDARSYHKRSNAFSPYRLFVPAGVCTPTQSRYGGKFIGMYPVFSNKASPHWDHQ